VDTLLTAVIAAAAGYLLGSVSFAIVVSRVMALPDPRSYGSKNPGATNVLRSGSKVAALLTLLGDGAKGWFAAWLAFLLTRDLSIASVAGLAAFLGHLWPGFHRFAGGKGVATAAGVLLGIDWRIGAGTIATWLIIAVFLRYSSLAALVAAAFAPLAAFVLLGAGAPFLCILAMAALLVWRHKQNIARLVEGSEPRLGAKKPDSAPSGGAP